MDIVSMSTTKLIKFIDKAKIIHGTKYDYSKVVYNGVHIPVIIICNIHGEFNQTPVTHTSKQCGCPTCGRLQANKTMANTTLNFVNKAISIHGNKYDYSTTIYRNNYTPIQIICPVHGRFEQRPNKHILSKIGCPRCSRVTNLSDFINEANNVHNTKYNYEEVIYIKSSTPISIICPVHDKFVQTPNNHLQGYGCPLCGDSQSKGLYCESTLNGTILGAFPGILYFISLTDVDDTVFYKIGISQRTLDIRFPGYKILSSVVVPGTLYELYKIEQSVLSKYKNFKYSPTIMKSNGHTECFKLSLGIATHIIDNLTGYKTYQM